MPYEITPVPNQHLMDDLFHDWLEKCPNNWVRLDIDQDSATYKFYKNDIGGDDD